MHDSPASEFHSEGPIPNWWRHWWRRQTPTRQDRYAMLAPLAAVLLFLAAIVSAFWYLRLEEMDREQEAVKRDVEYAQQRGSGVGRDRENDCARLHWSRGSIDPVVRMTADVGDVS